MKNDIVRNLIEKLQALAAENGWTVIWSIERTPHGYVTFSFNNGKDGRERKRFLKQISYDILLESRVSVDMLAERIIKEVYEAFEKRTQDGFRTNVQIVDEMHELSAGLDPEFISATTSKRGADIRER